MPAPIHHLAAKVLLGVALLGSITFVVPNSSAQVPAVRQYALSPAAQQGFVKVRSLLPPGALQLWWNSVQALGPRVEDYLSFQNTKSPVYLSGEVRMVLSLMQPLPPQLQQKFMNGMVGVSQEDEMFARQVMIMRIRQNRADSRAFAIGQIGREQQGSDYECALDPDSCARVSVYPYLR